MTIPLHVFDQFFGDYMLMSYEITQEKFAELMAQNEDDLIELTGDFEVTDADMPDSRQPKPKK